MKDRIQAIIDNEQMSASRFAEVIGVQRSSVSHIISGRNNPSLDFVQKIINSFPNINTNWLLTGKGNMYINDAKEKIIEKSSMKENTLFDDLDQPKIENGNNKINSEIEETTKKVNDKEKESETVTPQQISDNNKAQEDKQELKKTQIREESAPPISDTNGKAEVIDLRKTDPEKIIVFYSNKTFTLYSPSGE